MGRKHSKARDREDAAAKAWRRIERELDEADALFDRDDFRGAAARYRAVTEAHPEVSDAWYGLGLCAEAEGREDEQIAAWLRALATDDAAPPPPDHLTEEEFARVAEEALADLPARARELLQNVPVVVAERPSPDDVRQGLDPRTLGLFAGAPFADDSLMGAFPTVTQIVLFRDNLERATFHPDELREEIRITVLHEIGHFFGMDEDDLAEAGLD